MTSAPSPACSINYGRKEMEVRRRCEFSASELAELKENAFVMEYTITYDMIKLDMVYIVKPITSLSRKDD